MGQGNVAGPGRPSLAYGFGVDFLRYFVKQSAHGVQHAFGAVQDINAYWAAGIGRVATVIGARATVQLAALLYHVVVFLLLIAGAVAESPMLLAASVLAFPYAFNVLRFSTVDDERRHRESRMVALSLG